MDDATKLLLAQRRLLNLSRDKSLIELSTLKIVKNIKWFLNDSEHQEKLTKFPSLLRKELLDKVTCKRFVVIDEEEKDMFSRIKAFELLLCPQIKEIKLQGFMAVDPTRFDKILEIITTRAPNLISLTIVWPHGPYQDFPILRNFPVSIKEIGKLAKLRKLVLRSSIVDYKQVKEMCRNELRNLRYLHVCLNFDSDTNFEDTKDFKESFSNLQYFFFDSYRRDENVSPRKYGKMLRKMCMKHLPNLIAVEKNVHQEMQMASLHLNITEIPSEASALRHLSVMPGTVEIHRAFPEITNLKIRFDGNESNINIEKLLQFQNIKKLFLLNVTSSETVNKFIRRYGPKLETLYLVASETINDIRLKFKSLFKSCPRLETLVLICVDMIDDGEPIPFFSKLKDLTWIPERGRTLCLSNVVQAPDLQVLLFLFNSFDVDDLRKVSDLIAKKEILRKLQFLNVINVNIYESYELKNAMENQNFMASFRAVSEMMKNASAFLPVLNHFDLVLKLKCTGVDLNEQPLVSYSRYIDKNEAAALRILDTNLLDFLIAFKRNYFSN